MSEPLPLSQALGQYITSTAICQGVLKKFSKKLFLFGSVMRSAVFRVAINDCCRFRVANRCYYSTEKVESQPAKMP